MVVDNLAPALAITAPAQGRSCPESPEYAVTCTSDRYVAAENGADSSILSTTGTELELTGHSGRRSPSGSPGSYAWTVPDVPGDDVDTYQIRITAVDMAGTALGRLVRGKGTTRR